jgi:hypothetical protein
MAGLGKLRKPLGYTHFYTYNKFMKFTWREPKRNENRKKHGFDFADAERVFNGPSMTEEDDRD